MAARRAQRADLTDPAPVMEAAARLLSVRQRSVSEMNRRLVRLGYPTELVEQVVAQLVELHFLDDALFARAWIESRDRARPRGEHVLRRELFIKGIARELIDELLVERSSAADHHDADRGAARALLERRRSSLEREADPRRRRQKAYALLARNGFDAEICRDTVNAAFSDA